MNGILVDQNSGDLMVDNGTIAIGDNTLQCIERIIVSNRGEFKEHPLLGAEIYKMMHGSVSRFWASRVRNMCAAAGVKIRNVSVTADQKIQIEI